MAEVPNFHIIDSPEIFKDLLSKDLNRVSLLNFWATWAEPCKQMNQIVFLLAKQYSSLLVLQIDAEAQSDISESFDVESVPELILLRGHTLLGRVPGADAAQLKALITKHVPVPIAQSTTSQAPAAAPITNGDSVEEETTEELDGRIRKLMGQQKVMLFMKGTPDTPRCGFSRKMVNILKDQNVEFGYFDILTDQSVRNRMKVLNDWPTFPQLIVSGELIGGLDICQEMVNNGEFADVVA